MANLSEIKQNYDKFYFIDIRGIQSYNNSHLKDSYHFQSKEKIFDFISKIKNKKDLVLLCSSAKKAKNMADSLMQMGERIRTFKFLLC
ncbi:rhodanese-like domain-containing protein [Campylobacter sp. LR291e]|uniref:rhodanese-like domain-containing protein n=1 Tax=Campylobacter sp. LR291e TaxID=2593546 RepID=UPI001CC1C5F9|nr:rhodanese-like domain-containing protein [Campylobacter sp. LR291e]